MNCQIQKKRYIKRNIKFYKSNTKSNTSHIPSQVEDNDQVRLSITKRINNKLLNNTISGKFDFKKEILLIVCDEQLTNDFLTVRKNKKLSNTKTAFDRLIKEIGLSGYTPQEIIKMCVEKSWGGFEKKWLDNLGLSKSINQDGKDDKKAKEIEKLRSLGWSEENIKLATENNNW